MKKVVIFVTNISESLVGEYSGSRFHAVRT